ncbi:MAG TPA: radical SAM protein [Candidatus Nanoarchaeia archaeon]|nr:radical SAM protein [Candidatus Nanoarchaeia archaeon]
MRIKLQPQLIVFTDGNYTKAEILCRGINVKESNIMDLIKAQNPFNELRSGLGYGWYIMLDGNRFVNASVYFGYTKNSPFTVEKKDGQLTLVHEGKAISRISPLPPPEWYFEKTSSGQPMGRIFQQHGKNALTTAVYAGCQFFTKNNECKFCKMGDGESLGALKIKSVDDLVEAAVRAIRYNPNYEVDINGGTTYTDGTGFEIFIPRVAAIRKALPTVRIAVEAAPPLDNSYIRELKEAGANVLMMNLELFDEEKRREYCPGKSDLIPRARFIDALDYAVNVFGKGNVSSCLIAGLEDTISTIEGARFLIGRGIVPSILPYRPITTKIDSGIRLDVTQYLIINREVGLLLRSSDLGADKQAGCVGCTGCSLEVDLSR